MEPERRSVSSCCAATPTKVDLTWLKNNPGQLFNTPELLSDRQAMLDNNPVSSCESSCWAPERAGLPSRRTNRGSQDKTHVDLHASPRVLNINVGSDCNLTCSYCCKQYSSAWMRDINENGRYLDEERYILNNNDRIVLKLGQRAIKTSEVYTTILREAQQLRSVEQIEISGGEPFLYNGLPELVNGLSAATNIYTGLGVSTDRFIKILDNLPSGITFTVSAETTGKLYEFNRFGNTWDQFRRNLDVLSQRFPYRFGSVLSNLTIHGIDEFQKEFGADNNILSSCTDPEYLSASVLDADTKSRLRNIAYNYHDNLIKQTLAKEPTLDQKEKLRTYLTQFAERRQLSLEIFPESFITWLNTPQH